MFWLFSSKNSPPIQGNKNSFYHLSALPCIVFGSSVSQHLESLTSSTKETRSRGMRLATDTLVCCKLEQMPRKSHKNFRLIIFSRWRCLHISNIGGRSAYSTCFNANIASSEYDLIPIRMRINCCLRGNDFRGIGLLLEYCWEWKCALCEIAVRGWWETRQNVYLQWAGMTVSCQKVKRKQNWRISYIVFPLLCLLLLFLVTSPRLTVEKTVQAVSFTLSIAHIFVSIPPSSHLLALWTQTFFFFLSPHCTETAAAALK